MKRARISLLLTAVAALAIGIAVAIVSFWPRHDDEAEVLRKSWAGYLHAFVREGRVVRPRNGFDTVSEGQAYAMLRAVTASDREAFDAILGWTERNLSRSSKTGDHLLAWHYLDGHVHDWQSATDADIDYAYALLLASKKWDEPSYALLAREVLSDIFRLETIHYAGSLRLLPWSRKPTDGTDVLVQNPSYYSPAQFKLFYAETGDRRWLELACSGYDLLDALQDESPARLVPDWCGIDSEGETVPLHGYSSDYGWDAIRVPMRIALDHALFHEPRAASVLARFARFYEGEFRQLGHVHAAYAKDGRSVVYDESPLSYAAAYAALEASDSPLSERAYRQIRRSLRNDTRSRLYFVGDGEYYANSLCWLPVYHRLLTRSGETAE